ncbi:MAG: hypothetical protein MRERC_2c108 [Mycoplasmataceae bacterium RC_NB112A]|nr:MAG: hypothetical protein MRERC_2c108 [Mycoplasmataceae bacterium RC_NB112A]
MNQNQASPIVNMEIDKIIQFYQQKTLTANELLSNIYPYTDLELEEDIGLALAVCNELRPKISKVPIPQELKDLIKRCWDTEQKNQALEN